MAKTWVEREKARKRLAGFINTPRELLILQAWRLELGKALIFFEAEEFERIERLTKLNDLNLDRATEIREKKYGLDRATARKQVEKRYAEARKKQRERLRDLPGLLQEAFQKAMDDLEPTIRAPIFQALDIDIAIEDPFAKPKVETRVKKGVAETKALMPPHRPKDSGGFDNDAFLAGVNASICTLAIQHGRIPKQGEVAGSLKNFHCGENTFAQRYKRCETGMGWNDYARDVLRKAGIALKHTRKK